MATALELAKSGLSKSKVLAILTNDWNINYTLHRPLDIHEYYVRRWESSYVRELIRDGMITHEAVTYAVIYRSCTPSSMKHHLEMKCSFRASGNGNFVLIQPVTKSRDITTDEE
jgi:hypothetical protein